ncbi:hypothetical protein LCGC14_1167380 [marine sediment metagenome]|uniref:Uncharacterized protein n=1 Tax=marine sediment metagenome TaxID=412755 RepID=A0A0F9PWA5_9ZZZZ
MKIRNGFVSNSSSSSYIVSVPKDFIVTKDMVTKQAMVDLWENEILSDEDDGVNQKALDLINSEIDSLKDGQEVHGCDVFWAVQDILEENNMIVMTVDGAGGDGEDSIIPFKDERKNKQ